jgi:hypothetical protein
MKGSVTYSYMRPDVEIGEQVFKVIRTIEEERAPVSEVIAGFNEEQLAQDFCRTWNGDTNK